MSRPFPNSVVRRTSPEGRNSSTREPSVVSNCSNPTAAWCATSPRWTSVSRATAASPRRSTCSSPETPTPSLRCRSEEHTSELQSRFALVCRVLLEKKKRSSSDVNSPHIIRMRLVLESFERYGKNSLKAYKVQAYSQCEVHVGYSTMIRETACFTGE